MNFSDLSHHNPAVVFSGYKAGGRDRVVLKATEATTFVDPAFSDRWMAAKAAGVKRVAYHFLRNNLSGAAQFNHFIAVVKAAGFDPARDMLCVDTEDPNTPARALACTVEFVNAAVAGGITQGLIYSYHHYITVNGLIPAKFPAGWRKLWYANYTDTPDAALPIPNGWVAYARQYSSTATVTGVTGKVDDSRLLREFFPVAPKVDPVTSPDSNPWNQPIKVPSDRQKDFVHSAYPAGTILLDVDTWLRHVYTALVDVSTLLQTLIDAQKVAQTAPAAPVAPTPVDPAPEAPAAPAAAVDTVADVPEDTATGPVSN